jgi:hypothetical protein
MIPIVRPAVGHIIINKETFLIKHPTNLNALTKADRLKYALIISLSRPVHDQCKISKDSKVYKVNIHLQNNSKDTLKYIDWYCSSEIWNADNKKLNIYEPFEIDRCGGCDKNMITYFEVPPHENKALYVYTSRKENNLRTEKFKIGMILQRVVKMSDFYFYENYFEDKNNLSDQKMNIIWSNSIEMP